MKRYKLITLSVAVVLILTATGLMHFTAKSLSDEICGQLIKAVNNPQSANYIRNWMNALIKNRKWLEGIAKAGGDLSSYELPRAFKLLDINFDWRRGGVSDKRVDVYIAIEGDWWEENGTIDTSKITSVAVGVNRRMFIAMSLDGKDIPVYDVSGSIIQAKYEQDGLRVYCR
jgi:hypothetical protein